VSGIGADLDMPSDPVELFGEGGGHAVVACAPSNVDRLPQTVALRKLGVVGGDRLGGLPLVELERAWNT